VPSAGREANGVHQHRPPRARCYSHAQWRGAARSSVESSPLQPPSIAVEAETVIEAVVRAPRCNQRSFPRPLEAGWRCRQPRGSRSRTVSHDLRGPAAPPHNAGDALGAGADLAAGELLHTRPWLVAQSVILAEVVVPEHLLPPKIAVVDGNLIKPELCGGNAGLRNVQDSAIPRFSYMAAPRAAPLYWAGTSNQDRPLAGDSRTPTSLDGDTLLT
jgi:hypothetical protein